jgi:hypothetical protein
MNYDLLNHDIVSPPSYVIVSAEWQSSVPIEIASASSERSEQKNSATAGRGLKIRQGQTLLLHCLILTVRFNAGTSEAFAFF